MLSKARFFSVLLVSLVFVLSAIAIGAPESGRLPWGDYQELLRWQVMAPGIEVPEREYMVLTTRPVGDDEVDELAELGVTVVAAAGRTAVVRGPITAFSGLGPDGEALPWAHTFLPSVPQGTSGDDRWYGIDVETLTSEIGLSEVDLTGQGVTVGVIDGGFTGAFGAELDPESVEYVKVEYVNGRGRIVPMTENDFSTHGVHGEMCARAVANIAPDVNFVLMAAPTMQDRLVLLEHIAAGALDVDVVTDSTYTPIPFDHNDGVGTVAQHGDAVVESGVFYAYAIGNFGRGQSTDRSFYRAQFTDTDGDRSHDFSPAASAESVDRNTLKLTLDPWDGPRSVRLLVVLEWDGWEHNVRAADDVSTSGYWEDDEYVEVQDIDLFLYYQDGTRVVPVGESIANQLGPLYEAFRRRYPETHSVPPLEVIQVDVDQPGTYLINVRNVTVSAHDVDGLFERDVNFHLYVHARGTSFAIEEHTREGSIINMGGAHGVTAVGAVRWTDDGWTVAPHSSWGPTSDGRLKPELVAPEGYESGLTGLRHRFFTGTSAAAPLVAGVAALLLEADESLSPDELRALLTEGATPLCGAEALSEPCIDAPPEPNLCEVWNYTVGCGLLNAEEAMQLLQER